VGCAAYPDLARFAPLGMHGHRRLRTYPYNGSHSFEVTACPFRR
jgi:hypothetical protein